MYLTWFSCACRYYWNAYCRSFVFSPLDKNKKQNNHSSRLRLSINIILSCDIQQETKNTTTWKRKIFPRRTTKESGRGKGYDWRSVILIDHILSPIIAVTALSQLTQLYHIESTICTTCMLHAVYAPLSSPTTPSTIWHGGNTKRVGRCTRTCLNPALRSSSWQWSTSHT